MTMHNRRSFLTAALGAAALHGTSAGQTAERDWSGKNPIRYPDPDILVLDKKFNAPLSMEAVPFVLLVIKPSHVGC